MQSRIYERYRNLKMKWAFYETVENLQKELKIKN